MKSLRLFKGLTAALLFSSVFFPINSWARDLSYESGEIVINVTPGEPTQLTFPGTVAGGFKRSTSTVNVTPKKNDLVIFAGENVPATGEALIVRLDDGRSYPLRIMKSGPDTLRDDIVRIMDDRPAEASSDDSGSNATDPTFNKSSPMQVPGLLRELVLSAEFGKRSINGYRVSDQHKGQQVLNDGTLVATIDRIYIGPTLWGYVLDAKNLLSENQRLNPATFRLDGTRAVSMEKWELAPTPLNIEQQMAGADRTKIYVITKARR